MSEFYIFPNNNFQKNACKMNIKMIINIPIRSLVEVEARGVVLIFVYPLWGVLVPNFFSLVLELFDSAGLVFALLGCSPGLGIF